MALMVGSAFAWSAASPSFAADLGPRLDALLSSHERIRAAQSDLDAARAQSDVAKGGYYPTASITTNAGRERIYTAKDRTTTSMATQETDLNLTQTLYDFGATDAVANSAQLAVKQAEMNLDMTRQTVLLEAVSAELNLASAKRVLDYQVQSEASIKRQTEMEDARVKRGSGYSTDVLQAKTQLAGAQAARVRAEGALRQAVNRYRAVYGDAPANLDDLADIKIQDGDLPTSEDDAVSMALNNNHQVKISGVQQDIAKSEIDRSVATGFRPTLNASADQKYKDNVGGTRGEKNETLFKVELKYSFNMGFTASNTLKASRAGHAGAASRLKDSRDQVAEQARNAWQNLQTARENADLLENQANIASEFLELARKERTLGQRSLIDVLSGETALINAQAAADRARTDVAIASLALLNVMGQLDASVIH